MPANQQWIKLPRSIRLSANGMTADVWPVFEKARMFRHTVIDDATGVYLDSGASATEDHACELALRTMHL